MCDEDDREQETSDDRGGVDPGNGKRDGQFLVTHADEDSAVLKDIDSGQVHTLGENPPVDVGDLVEGTIAPEPPMEVTYRPVDLDTRRNLSVEESSEPPTRQERELAAEQSIGELTKRERAGEGEIHVLTVFDEGTEAAVEDVLNDEATLVRAARLDVDRVEIRSDPGVVSIRYLP